MGPGRGGGAAEGLLQLQHGVRAQMRVGRAAAAASTGADQQPTGPSKQVLGGGTANGQDPAGPASPQVEKEKDALRLERSKAKAQIGEADAAVAAQCA